MEIERKFLAQELPQNLHIHPSATIEQSYISFSPTIRIRKKNESFFLTVKGKGHMVREEFEMEILEEEYLILKEKIDGKIVVKTRYFILLEHDFIAEFDVYEGDLLGLYTIEVEFEKLEIANQFVPPLWFGREVTQDPRYKNTWLSKNGIPIE